VLCSGAGISTLSSNPTPCPANATLGAVRIWRPQRHENLLGLFAEYERMNERKGAYFNAIMFVLKQLAFVKQEL